MNNCTDHRYRVIAFPDVSGCPVTPAGASCPFSTAYRSVGRGTRASARACAIVCGLVPLRETNFDSKE